MKISIAADNRGLGHKSKVKAILERLGHEVIDHGTHTEESVDYPDFGGLVAEDVAEGRVDTGITVCMTGNGMNMTVNRFPGIRGALVLSAEMARLARAHNDANVLTLSEQFTPEEELEGIVRAWVDTKFEGGRHEIRVNKMRNLECGTGPQPKHENAS